MGGSPQYRPRNARLFLIGTPKNDANFGNPPISGGASKSRELACCIYDLVIGRYKKHVRKRNNLSKGPTCNNHMLAIVT